MKKYLLFFMLFALCKFNGYAQLIQNITIEESTTTPFILQNDRIYLQIQLFDENFNVFLDNGAPKTKITPIIKHENRYGVIQHYFLIHIPDFKNSFYQNIPLVFLVDLGARSSIIADKTIKKVDYEKFSNDPSLISCLFSSEIMFNRPNMRISYSIGGKVSEFPQEEAFVHFDGWIGVDILKRFHSVIFDYQGKKLYVKI